MRSETEENSDNSESRSIYFDRLLKGATVQRNSVKKKKQTVDKRRQLNSVVPVSMQYQESDVDQEEISYMSDQESRGKYNHEKESHPSINFND